MTKRWERAGWAGRELVAEWISRSFRWLFSRCFRGCRGCRIAGGGGEGIDGSFGCGGSGGFGRSGGFGCRCSRSGWRWRWSGDVFGVGNRGHGDGIADLNFRGAGTEDIGDGVALFDVGHFRLADVGAAAFDVQRGAGDDAAIVAGAEGDEAVGAIDLYDGSAEPIGMMPRACHVSWRRRSAMV